MTLYRETSVGEGGVGDGFVIGHWSRVKLRHAAGSLHTAHCSLVIGHWYFFAMFGVFRGWFWSFLFFPPLRLWRIRGLICMTCGGMLWRYVAGTTS
jgi:hypothetical protein